MMSCRELTELVTNHLEGNLSPEDQTSFRMHIGMCKSCRAYLLQMEHTVELLGKLPEDFTIPDNIQEAFRQHFHMWQTSPEF